MSAAVQVRRTGGSFALRAETDQNGAFTTADLGPGEYRVQVTKSGYVPAILGIVAPRPSGSQEILIRLLALGAIAGQVLDSQGRPVSGGRVRALRKVNHARLVPTGREAVVDDRGAYRLWGLPPGDYAVSLLYDSSRTGTGIALYPAGASAESTRLFPVTNGEQHTGVDFILGSDAQFRLSGAIHARQGRDAAGFTIALTAPSIPDLVIASRPVENGGAFRFDGVPPGSYDLAAVGPSIGTVSNAALLGERPLYGRLRITVSGANLDGVSVPVEEGNSAALRLRVAGDEGRRCPARAWLRLAANVAWPAYLPQANVQLGTERPQTVSAMPPGPYSVTISELGDSCYVRAFECNGTALNEPVLDLSASGSTCTVILSSETAAVNGRLSTRAASPELSAVRLMALDPAPLSDPFTSADSGPVQVAYPDAQGHFSFVHLRPGRYRLVAETATSPAPGDSPVQGIATEVRLRPGEEVAINLEMPLKALPQPGER